MTGRTMAAPAVDDWLDVLCPMHLRLSRSGHIVHAGPVLERVVGAAGIEARRFLEVFELRRPRIDGSMRALRGLAGQPLRLRLRRPPGTGLKGVLAPLGRDAGAGLAGGAVVNLSFGIALPEAVRDFGLTSRDFAATDLAIEMLYLIEAKSAAMEASRKLNLRLQGARIAAEEQAFTDTLTGLGNRRALQPVLSRLIEGGGEFALMALDLDFFKAVNDRLGHAAGDHVLQQAARAMLAETRAEDRVLRVGGDEFVLLLPGLSRRAQVDDLARRLIARLEVPVPYGDETCRISASIGATLRATCPGACAEQMIADADAALYAAKAAGRGRHVVHGAAG